MGEKDKKASTSKKSPRSDKPLPAPPGERPKSDKRAKSVKSKSPKRNKSPSSVSVASDVYFAVESG